MLIVLSDSDFKQNETAIINQLFHEGLDLLHLRKYGANEKSLVELIAGIKKEYHARLVLHHQHEWGRSIGLKRFHYSEKDRELWKSQSWSGIANEEIYSTSVHDLETFNELEPHFSYAFISPVFDSISKTDYKAVTFDLSKRRNNHAKLIALGGVRSDNVNQVFQMGFDGAALLGAIWNSNDAKKEWNLCCRMRSIAYQ